MAVSQSGIPVTRLLRPTTAADGTGGETETLGWKTRTAGARALG